MKFLPKFTLHLCFATCLNAFCDQLTIADLAGANSVFCAKALKQIVAEAVVGHDVVHVQRLDQIYELLITGGLGEKDARYISEALATALSQAPVGSLLRQLSGTLKNPKHQERLFVCIPGGACRLKDGQALLMSQYDQDATPTAIRDDLDRFPYNLFSQNHLNGPKFIIQTIVLPPIGQAYAEKNLMIAKILHEAQHYHDWILVSNWIAKNNRRLAEGGNADPLYQSTVRAFGPGIVIDAGFDRFFGEARAYAVMAEIEARYPSGWTTKEIRESGYQQIIDEGGKAFMDKMGVTPLNLFEKADEIATILNAP